ncbi:hypothetical protein BC830DRAFT_1083386 [Chytriomyces sp. MP71]|nr:hypothetical protein BC830DRAFT_1083386 [Chytriomyces sp. MP71]
MHVNSGGGVPAFAPPHVPPQISPKTHDREGHKEWKQKTSKKNERAVNENFHSDIACHASDPTSGRTNPNLHSRQGPSAGIARPILPTPGGEYVDLGLGKPRSPTRAIFPKGGDVAEGSKDSLKSYGGKRVVGSRGISGCLLFLRGSRVKGSWFVKGDGALARGGVEAQSLFAEEPSRGEIKFNPGKTRDSHHMVKGNETKKQPTSKC